MSSLAERLASSDRPDRMTALRERIQTGLVESLGPRLYDPSLSDEDLRGLVETGLRDLLAKEEIPLAVAERRAITREVTEGVLGLGPLEELIQDPDVTEVMVNDYETIYVERSGKLQRAGAHFTDPKQLMRVIEKIVATVGRRIDEASPYVDARLPDGSRVNAIIPPLALDGPALTIRKFSAEPFTVADLVSFGTFNDQVATFLQACVEGRMNILVSGGTGAGKTSTLNVLSSLIPSDERIVTIEDAAELRLQQPHVVRLECRPPNIEGSGAVTTRDLVRNALRMRPDRIVVGEVRGEETLDMLQAMNTGHDGSITTVHANSPRDVLSRLETMTLMSGMDLTVRAIREQVAAAMDLIVHQARLKDGTRRITHVTEVLGMEGEVITLQDIFVFAHEGRDARGLFQGSLRPTGIRPKLIERLADMDVHVPTQAFITGMREMHS